MGDEGPHGEGLGDLDGGGRCDLRLGCVTCVEDGSGQARRPPG